MRSGLQPDRGTLPLWARAAVVVYLSVTVALVAALLLTEALETGLADGVHEALLWVLMVLTLPVSVAYLVLGTFGSARPPAPAEFNILGLSPTAVLYYLGFVLLAVVNSAVLRWVVLSARKCTTPDRVVRFRGVNPNVRNLWWTVPLAVLLSLPQWFVAGISWCGISGCSGGGFGISTGTEWLAASLSAVNGLIFAVAVFAVRWLYPTGRRAAIAAAAGTLFALIGAAITHG